MKDSIQLLCAIFVMFSIYSCGPKHLKLDSEALTQNTPKDTKSFETYSSFDQIKDIKSKAIIKKELPKQAQISTIRIFPIKNKKTILVDYIINNQKGTDTYIETFNIDDNSTSLTKIKCVGSCNSSSPEIPCGEHFDPTKDQISCGCQSDNCSMNVTTF